MYFCVSAAMGSESIMSCRCLLLAALALHCAASGVASEGSTEVSAGVAADADHQQHDAGAADEWPLPSNNLEKRAYYVSEYKRLPVYNFGLGKRSPEPAANRYYAFGLGKRERGAGSRQYSFGLGKRPNNLYSFGLGKRSMDYAAPNNAVSSNYFNSSWLEKKNLKLFEKMNFWIIACASRSKSVCLFEWYHLIIIYYNSNWKYFCIVLFLNVEYWEEIK